MRRWKIILTAAAFLLVLPALQGCMPGKRLMAKSTDPAAVAGTYTLLLYGCLYQDDIENAAFLIVEGGRYPFEIFAPDASYKVKKGLSAQQALAEANEFVRCGFRRVWGTQLLRIPDDSGGTIGYELRPLYAFYEVGSSDVLLINYSLKDGKVIAYIRLSPEMEKRRYFFDVLDSSSGIK